MYTIRKKLSATEGVSETQRYNQDEDVFQTSFDGGETWVDTPESDPRHNPALINPTNTDDACAAAQGFSNFVREFVDSTFDAFNVVGISSTAINIGLLFVPQIALFWRVAQLVAEGILGVGAVTLAATFTETVYDQIRDIAFCHIDATGHFSQEDFDAIGADLQEEIGGSAFNITMALLYNIYGLVGFSNAAIELAEEAECEPCAFCVLQDWFVDPYEWAVVSDAGFGDLGVYTPPFASRVGHRIAEGDYGTFIVIQRFLNLSADFERIEIDYDLTPGTFTAGTYTGVQLIADGVTVVDEVVSGTGTLVWEPVTPFEGFLRFNCLLSYVNTGGSSDGSGQISAIRYYGSGSSGIDTLLGVECEV